jgi:hypothetical protein
VARKFIIRILDRDWNLGKTSLKLFLNVLNV